MKPLNIILSFGFSRQGISFGSTDFGLGYLDGLRELGHNIILIEEVTKKECFNSDYTQVPFSQWEGIKRFETFILSHGLQGKSCLFNSDTHESSGMPYKWAKSKAQEADLLINFAGSLKCPEIISSVDCRAYFDRNCGIEQVYTAEYGLDYGFKKHNYFFTAGLNIGDKDCEIPTCDCLWNGSLIPVVLAKWPRMKDLKTNNGKMTTISGWGNSETFNYKGRYSGNKLSQWLRFIDVPNNANQLMEIAIDEDASSALDFVKKDWSLYDTRDFMSVMDYRQYIRQSMAEFSVAKEPFVYYQIGWCGDRISRYLASGRPVIVQSTGFEKHLQVGKGLLSFSTEDEAVECIERVKADYIFHCREARRLAEWFFDSKNVLNRVLNTIGF